MFKFGDKLFETIIQFMISLLGACLVTIWLNLKDPLKNIAIQIIYYDTNKSIILMTLILLVLTVIILLFLSYHYYKKQKIILKPYFGILWNHKGDGYCPSCEVPLSLKTFESANSCSYKCSKCKVDYPIYDEFGHVISLTKAQEYIKKPTKRNFKKYIQSQ